MGRIHALLIGIDGYLPSRRPGFVAPIPLAGSVRDARAAEVFLRERLRVPAAQIELLLAPASGSGTASGTLDLSLAPSYQNMVAAWERAIARAESGDELFVLYSGHGCRVPTTSPKLKGRDGLDECLVPYDIAEPRARYLRDTEICRLLRRLSEREVFTTVVLDCCHSGGASRDGVAVRGTDWIDRTPREEASLVGSPAELEQAWRQARPAGRGVVRAEPSWEEEPSGYVLFAACRPHEQAFEAAFDGLPPRGALSYWLLRLLDTADPSCTWRRLHERVTSRVRGRFLAQTPLVEGEADRAIFGGGRLPPPPGIAVLEVEESLLEGVGTGRLQLPVGRAHGIREGATFALQAASRAAGEERLGMAEAREVGATSSWAEVVEWLAEGRRPTPGDEAVLLDPGSLCLRRPVRILGHLPEAGGGLRRSAASPDLASELRNRVGAFLEMDGPEDLEGFFVWADDRGVFQVGDETGRPWPGLEPAIRVGEPQAFDRLAERLTHLAKYRNVRELENHDPRSALRNRLRVDLGRLPQGYRRGGPIRHRKFRPTEQPPTVAEGEWICVEIGNTSREALNVAMVDLSPDWGIAQVYPLKALADFVTLESGKTLVLPLLAQLPPGLDQGIDRLKVFATRGPSSLCWLELPTLGQPHLLAGALRGTATSPLQRLFASLAVDEPAHRTARLPPSVADDWWVEQVEVRVVRGRS